MENTEKLLSICIPTFNRAQFLQRTLQSIVDQVVFITSDSIEVVISDNCSDDETEPLSLQFSQAYPGKIRYFRNATNVGGDANFEMALTRGNGAFLKLHNDNLLVRNGSLTELLKVITATRAEQPIIFCTNGNNNIVGGPIAVCNSMNAFVQHVSFFSTWIGGFGIWKEQFEKIPDFSVNAHLHLVQTDILFRLLATGKRAIVLYDVYFHGLDIGRKGGYNIAEVFGQNYLSILKKYLTTGTLEDAVFQSEKKTILLRHIIPYYFDSTNGFSKTGFFQYMHDYAGDDYFHKAIENLITRETALPPPLPQSEITMKQQIANHWRQLNPHNETIMEQFHGQIDFSKVKVGRKTYGGLTLWHFGGEGESLTIGNFVSIADDVKFLLGGGHAYQGLSTFPFQTKYFATREAISKGPVTIADDVWIGYGSTILSGVNVGQGAIIAAGSVVTTDVAPYSIVGGNPAKLIKFRFESPVIEKLCRFDFSQLSDETILRNRESLYTTITPENIEFILTQLTQP
jgi:acetyltransferase-like isoleucine patch superfamily enzyme/glycosyltransferase involved in cell wall biosynthesis